MEKRKRSEGPSMGIWRAGKMDRPLCAVQFGEVSRWKRCGNRIDWLKAIEAMEME
jgi:hypothetical protein